MKELIISPVATLVVIPLMLYAFKKLWEHVTKRKERLRADYDLAEKLMIDGRWKNMHEFQLELGYQGLSKKRIKASIIRFFLSRKEAYQNLLDFSIGERFLDVVKTENETFRISLSRKLGSARKLKVKRSRISIRYSVFSFIGSIPIIGLLAFGYSEQSKEGNLPIWSLIVVWVAYFWMLAYLELRATNALKAAERIHKKFGQPPTTPP
ncbi:MAG: hypothetical protein WA958_11615 [Tunicatimonas sp.]